MDTKVIAQGSRLYLPVFSEGALLAAGDLHALMGDGEVGVTGVEVAGKVTLTVKVRKDLKLENPVVRNQEVTATIASHEDLDQAAHRAVVDMVEIFSKYTPYPWKR